MKLLLGLFSLLGIRTALAKYAIRVKHPGCLNELKGILDIFGKEYDHTPIDGGPSPAELCQRYNAIILSDAVSFDTHLMEYFADGNCPNSTLILHITNRFDFYVRPEYQQFYLDIFRRLFEAENVFFAPNNPYEIYHFGKQGLGAPPEKRTRLCLPLGFYDPGMIKDRHYWKHITRRHGMFHSWIFEKLLFDQKSAIQDLTEHLYSFYGGPDALRLLFDFVVYIPYQVSVMKTHENLKAGVISVVPTRRLYAEIVKSLGSKRTDILFFSDIYDLVTEESDWGAYFDVYQADREWMFPQFDSWPELIDWIQNGIPIDVETHRSRMKREIARVFEKHKPVISELFRLVEGRRQQRDAHLREL